LLVHKNPVLPGNQCTQLAWKDPRTERSDNHPWDVYTARPKVCHQASPVWVKI